MPTVKAPTPDLSLPLTALTIDRGPTPFVGPPPVGHRNFPTTGVNFDMGASTVYRSGSSDIAIAFACDCVWLGQAHILAYESPISNPVQLTYTFVVRELCLRHLSNSTPPLDITGFLASSPVLPTPFLFAVSTMQECGFARFDHYVIAASLSHYVCFKHDGSSQSRLHWRVEILVTFIRSMILLSAEAYDELSARSTHDAVTASISSQTRVSVASPLHGLISVSANHCHHPSSCRDDFHFPAGEGFHLLWRTFGVLPATASGPSSDPGIFTERATSEASLWVSFLFSHIYLSTCLSFLRLLVYH
ncbi:hypothetical protein YC2023_106717 [Brassica napus]